MTTHFESPHHQPRYTGSQPVPTIHDPARVPLYREDFAADPHRTYTTMRARHGSLAQVELSPGVPATLVIGYRTAVRIGNDPSHFPADPRTWEQSIPDACPVKSMMQYRPNALRTAGTEHLRYRGATVDSINEIDLYNLHREIEGIAVPEVNQFCEIGQADLVSQYAVPVTFAYLNTMVGCSAEIGNRVRQGMAMMFEGDPTGEGNQMFVSALSDLILLKREQPGNDVATRLLQHGAGLGHEELVHQLVPIYGAGIEPLANLIANTLLLMLSDDRFQGDAALTTIDALNELLFKDPPLANFLITYPPQPILVEDVWLPAHQPVVTSMAACNNDPEIAGNFTDNRSHLAWGTGPHACPAQSVAYSVAQNAIDQLLDMLPEIRLACPAEKLVWRPGPFHRSLASLPVVFEPARPFPPVPR
ncbi:cytochrome P450 [Nocardia sp. NPDC051750]|uniref:cytochrome P450 n=1 Tax=Nocardia sp. NPDC051750 TaxID=3364325 RepID=UPI0037A1E8C2